ncbi:MAG: hypothetical protein JKX76_02720 [Colwellia sp.]|nr:hypothetical protein [Colwellia sp.]
MNSKSEIQEILAKRGLDLPAYTTINISDPDQISEPPLFQSEINFIFELPEQTTYTIKSDLFPSKKKAEKDAATKALVAIKQLLPENITDFHISENTIGNVFIFIDYENYNNDFHIDLFKEHNPSINVVKCTAKYHPRSNNADLTINSRIADATDILISCKVGELYSNENCNYETVIIITNDHFGSCIADIYQNCFHLPNIQETYKFLKL